MNNYKQDKERDVLSIKLIFKPKNVKIKQDKLVKPSNPSQDFEELLQKNNYNFDLIKR